MTNKFLNKLKKEENEYKFTILKSHKERFSLAEKLAVGKSVSLEGIPRFRMIICTRLKALAKGTGHVFETLLYWYALPTVGRKIDDRGGANEEGFIKAYLGFVTFAPVLYQARHEDWKYLMIPVATNMLSLIYESYRRVRSKEE